MITIRKSVILFLIFNSYILSAQKLKRIYFDWNGKQTTDKKNYEFYREGKLNEDGYFIDTVFLFYPSDKPFGREIYKDTFLNGPYVYYHENGKVKEKGIYRLNSRIGYSISYYSSGSPKSTYYYPEGQGQVTDFSEYDFLIINYWDSLSHQLVNNGNGYCECKMTYQTPDFLDLTNSIPGISPGQFRLVKLNSIEEVIAKGKVVDGLRDSIWTTYALDRLLYKEVFIKGKFQYGESYKNNEVFNYTKLIMTPESDGKGLSEFYETIGDKIKYPSVAKRMGIEGRVFVQFTVDEDGLYSDLRVIRGIGGGCDEEAMRVVKLAERKFIPVKKRGQPMKSRMVFPIIFKLG
jgi:TonB family protein